MRGGWNPDLEARTRCAVPTARHLIEAVDRSREDAIVTKDEWADADSSSGWEHVPSGGVRLTTTAGTKIENTTSDANQTDLVGPPGMFGAAPFHVARVQWGGTDDPNFEMTGFFARLNPDTGAGQNVVAWFCQPFGVIKVHNNAWGYGLELVPLAPAVKVTAGGSTADVEFSWESEPVRPRPKQLGVPEGGNSTNGFNLPTMYVFIWAVQSDGTAATNVAWLYDSGVASVTTNSNVLTGRELNMYEGAPEGFYYDDGSWGGTPRCKVESASYSSANIEFTSNPLDLGATPSGTVAPFRAPWDLRATATASSFPQDGR